MLSFATNHAPHVHLVKASPRTGAKAGRRFSEKEKKTQASCEETEIVAFSESDVVPVN